MSTRLAIIMLIAFNQSLSAGQVNHSSVDYKAGVYSLSLDVEIDAAFETVREIVTDYANLDQLSNMLIESAMISSPDDKFKRRLLVARTCILFFCRNVRMVEDIEEVGSDVIITTIIPEQSDFKSGQSQWRLTELDNQRSRIEFKGTQEPDFWVPPLIGPILVKRKLLKEALKLIDNLEIMAKHD